MSFLSNIYNTVIVAPLGWVLSMCYTLCGSYGISIILFTVIVKLILFPLGVKSHKNTIAQIRARPKEELIRKKYAKDQQRMQQEIMSLYEDEGFSMSGGCLPTLIQLPIIFALFSIINSPLTYMLRLTADQITAIRDTLGVVVEGIRYPEAVIAQAMSGSLNQLVGIIPEGMEAINFQFLGIFNLIETPSFNKLSVLWLIPILSGLTAYISSQYSQRHSMSSPEMASQMKTMNMVMPFMSLAIGFSMPAGVGLYWISSNLMALLQSVILNKINDPEKAYEEGLEKMQREKEERKRRKKELARLRKEEEEEAARDGGEGKGDPQTS